MYGVVTLFDPTFQMVPLRCLIRYDSPTTFRQPKLSKFGLFPFRSPLLRESLLFSLPPVNEMFQFAGFALLSGVSGLQPDGLPHSEISGSKVVCTSPKLIAAYHVLHRL